jgi:UDP:flavonoid glycosyltransferase YjiC (YdhE family)
MIKAVAGRRTLFYPGWSGVDPAALPSNFFALDDTPHDWLFPRTALVVHHGGAGTSHSAARAGVPSVVVPFAGDQFFWAGRLWQAGVAADALSWKHWDADRLAARLAAADTEDIRARAIALGAKMLAEDGLGAAVARVEQIMRH